MKKLLLIVIITFLSACASTKSDFVFDGSTAESTQQGISKVSKQLKPKEQMTFMMALLAIQFSEVSSAYEILGNPSMFGKMNYLFIGKKIDGLNYYSVLDLAESSQTKVSLLAE